MLRPEVIEKIKREREERERPAVQLPLYVPELPHPKSRDDIQKRDDAEKNRAVVIEMA